MKKAVIIDDDRLTLKILELVLQSRGYHVSAFVDINQMDLIELEADPVDLFIIDYNISGFNGIEIGENLKEICPEARFIAVSSTEKNKIESLHDEFEQVFDGFVHKPFKSEDFHEVLNV